MADDTKSGSRSIWKGAFSFGLVHAPVSLHTATDEQEVDFDWLDKPTMDPVGYKRVNKRTGKEIEATSTWSYRTTRSRPPIPSARTKEPPCPTLSGRKIHS